MKSEKSWMGLLIIPGILVFSSCSTEPGETTTMGAATGGVLGAGLGAIVGSQAGNAGTGMAVGAAAGAGAGAMVGNALEGQEEAIRTQDLAIEKQEQTIRTQQSDLDELRRMGQDRVVFKGQTARNYPKQEVPGSFSTESRIAQSAGRGYSPGLRENDLNSTGGGWSTSAPAGSSASALPAGSSTGFRTSDSGRARMGGEPADAGTVWDSSPLTIGAVSAAPRINTPECLKAENEVKNMAQVIEAADKLFHYRRALRMCPSNPAFHNGLGEVYMSLGRKADAEFEFKEALKLDPAFDTAVRNLNALNQPGANQNDARY